MSEGIPEATRYFLRSLNAGGEFHAFPKGTDWPRLKSFRTPYQWPHLSPPPWESSPRPPATREMSYCWGDLEDFGLIRVGHLADATGRAISPFGFQLTEKGRSHSSPVTPL
jgi:hypothetical protein